MFKPSVNKAQLEIVLMGTLFTEEQLLERTKLQGEYKEINKLLENDAQFYTIRDFHLALYLGIDGLKKFHHETQKAPYWSQVKSTPLKDYNFPLRRVLRDDARKTLLEFSIFLQRKQHLESMQEFGYSGEHVNKVK